MKETLNYIKVLNWGYGAFCGSFGDIAPLTLSQDFHSSIEQLGKRLAVVNSLDYEKMFVEATSAKGKANLLKYQSTEDSIDYSLHFMRDREQVLEACKATFKGFKGCADKYKDDKLWDEEQWGTYRTFLDQLERALELRLKQFATAYDKGMGPQQELINLLPEKLKTREVATIFQRAIDAKMLEKTATGFKWLQIGSEGGKAQLAYFAGKLFGYKYSPSGNTGSSVNYEGLEKLFGVTRLDRALQGAYEVRKPQWWREKIDAIFE